MITFASKLWIPESTIDLISLTGLPHPAIYSLQADPQKEVVWFLVNAWRKDSKGNWYDDETVPTRLVSVDIQQKKLRSTDTQDLNIAFHFGFSAQGHMFFAGKVAEEAPLEMLVYDDNYQVIRRLAVSPPNEYPSHICASEDGYLIWYRGQSNAVKKLSWDNEILWKQPLHPIIHTAHVFDLAEGAAVVAEYSDIAVISVDHEGKVRNREENGISALGVNYKASLNHCLGGYLCYTGTSFEVVRGIDSNSLLLRVGNRWIHFERGGKNLFCLIPHPYRELTLLPSGRCVATMFFRGDEDKKDLIIFEPSFPQKWYNLAPMP